MTSNPLLDGHRSTSAIPDRAGHYKPARINDFLLREGLVLYSFAVFAETWEIKGDQRTHIAIEIFPPPFT